MLRRDLVDDQHCQGVCFTVEDEEALAQAVALILIQEYSSAKAIFSETPVEDLGISIGADEIDDIVERRLKPIDVYHRDGFLFQLIMWLAAHVDATADDLVALPHAQASAKGQDCIVVHRAEGAVAAVSICEDKATENPRSTVRDEVWPEIQAYEAGGRRDELRSNIIATLGLGGVPADEAVVLVRGISWAGKRRYRVRVTVQKPRTKALFRGFKDLVAGPAEVRRGETMHLPELRAWMTQFAVKVENSLRSYAQQG